MHRLSLLLLVALACEGVRTTSSSGSGSGSGSSGSGSGSAAVRPAPPPVVTPLTISSKGLSTLGRYEWWRYDDQQTLALLRERIVLPNATVSIASKKIDREGYAKYTMVYWSVRRGDQELVQVLRDEGGAPEGPRPVWVIVLSPDVPTDTGIKVGDKASAIFARHSNIRCWMAIDATLTATITSRRTCSEYPGGALRYVLGEQGRTFPVGEIKQAKVANLPIIALVHQPFEN